MRWELHVADPARKALRRTPPSDQRRILAALEAMRDDPFQNDIVYLKHQSAAWRRRVGSWRIFFDVYPDVHRIVVAAICRRTSTTY